MIYIKEKKDCCGCEACAQVCAKKCISLVEDEEGFLYPKVDMDKCVDCGLCEKVCPVINQGTERKPLRVFASKHCNSDTRYNSSSGGAFSNIAELIIRKGGVVFGACFDSKWVLCHDYTETIEGISPFRGSKYLQSRIGDTFILIQNFLKQGRIVLFSGTPCQVLALKRFLRKEYNNLYTIDFICHGVPSPGVFRWYLQEEVNKYAARKSRKKNTVSFLPIRSIPKRNVIMPEGMDIIDIRFRDKREGWKKYSFALRLAEATAEGKKNSVSLSANLQDNLYLKGFISDMYLRPSCHQCSTKCMKSGSDITISDYWGQPEFFPDFDSDKGVSAIMPGTQKGLELISELSNKDCILIERTYEEVLIRNRAMVQSKPEPRRRKRFWNAVGRYSFSDCVLKASKPSLIERIESHWSTFKKHFI